MKELFKAVNEELQAERPVVFAGIIESEGSSPRHSGAAMLAFGDGSFLGTVGGGAVEARAMALCQKAFEQRASFIETLRLEAKGKSELDMLCGGTATLFFQYIFPTEENRRLFSTAENCFEQPGNAFLALRIRADFRWDAAVVALGASAPLAATSGFGEWSAPHLAAGRAALLREEGHTLLFARPLTSDRTVYLFGAGHIAHALAPLLSWLGFSTAVADNRPEYVSQERFPKTKRLTCADFGKAVELLPIVESDYIVIITRGHQYDYEVLAAALKTKARYIGMIGSRNKVREAYRRLTEDDGVPAEQLARVYAPIGIPIGSETPEEIAVSIAAELIRVRNSRGTAR